MKNPSNKTQPTRGFGKQPNGSFHYGTDWGWGSGRQVYAMLPGQVVSTQTLPDYGITVRVNHGHDANGDAIETRYCHLSAQTVKYGDWVAEGRQVGVMGSTGSLTKQVHLHSELWFNGTRIDERTYTPPAPPKRKTTLMRLITDTSGAKWLETENGSEKIAPFTADACYRVIYDADGAGIDPADIAIRDSVIALINARANKTPPTATIDYAALAKAVNDDAARRLAS